MTSCKLCGANAKSRKNWKDQGPDNIGGRVTCLIATGSDGNSLLAGTACGGVWRTAQKVEDRRTEEQRTK
jgi:hypothetical protein